ncbi:DUF4923 family protein [Bacteroides sp. OttesenSCG-928-D19]|nr:DUF4923 family protein [Bacteroides sp. OttesenSCG-928-N06]MDL2304872.1 DUF4923 family protein [Bacteroides sp. OttesenSCG-928-D19]
MKKRNLILIFTTTLLLSAISVQAQSLKDLLKSVTNQGNTNTGNSNEKFVGTWNYTGSAVEFKTEDLLQKAGGKVAAATVKSELDEQLTRLGIKPGLVDFTFNSNNTFTAIINKQKTGGAYTYNAKTETVDFTLAGFFTLNAKAKHTGNKISLLFEADKLLLLLAYFGEQSNNPAIKTIATLAGSYNGLLLGLEVKKK